MPSASVSVSTVSVSVSTTPSKSAPSVAQGASAPGGGFDQWMREAQSAPDRAAADGGESLPKGGKDLPAERQKDSKPAAESARDPQVKEQAAEGGQQPGGTEEASASDAPSSKDETVDAGASGSDEPQPDTAVPADVSVDVGIAEAAESEMAEAAEGARQAGQAKAVEQQALPEQATPKSEASPQTISPALNAENSDSESRGESQSEKTVMSQAPAGVQAADTAEVDTQVAADAGADRSAASAGDRSDVPKGQPSPGELPAQAARPEVRAAALQNGQRGDAQPGLTVSEIASDGRRTERTEAPSQVAPETEAKVSEAAPAEVDVSQSVAADTEAGEESTNAASTAVQVAAQAQVAVDGERAHVQSARDTVSQSIERNASAAQAASRVVADEANAQAGGQNAQSGNQQSSGQRNPAAEQILTQQGQGQQGAQGDAEASSAQSRSATIFSADARAAGDSANGTNAQSQPGSGLQASSAAPRADASAAAAAMAQRLQDPAWGRVMGQRAIMMAQYGPRTAEIQLDPPELGAMQIRIHMHGGDQVSVSFTSPNAQVRDAIEQQLPRLREMFAEQGMDLNQSSVSDQSARERGDDSRDGRGGQSATAAYGDADIGEETPVNLTQAPVGLVDYYA